MKLSKTQEEFIKSWGSLGSKWGLNKTLAQIHALFLITENSLSAEEIMETLKISRGNVNMNVRTLIDWGLVYKETKLGERKEFFIGEKDMWLIFKRVLKIRKERELDPMLKVLKTLKKNEEKDSENKNIINQIKNIEKFASEADNMLEKFIKMDENWFWSKFINLIK
ncbi:MAG: MarR family transcriptional regulator [Bacteroidales bacterium]|nr:MarR family transcriptional regulator [Bacteroidales bacterium]